MNTYLAARGILCRDAWLFDKTAEVVIAFVACIAVLNVCMKSLDARLCGESAVDFTFILRV